MSSLAWEIGGLDPGAMRPIEAKPKQPKCNFPQHRPSTRCGQRRRHKQQTGGENRGVDQSGGASRRPVATWNLKRLKKAQIKASAACAGTRSGSHWEEALGKPQRGSDAARTVAALKNA